MELFGDGNIILTNEKDVIIHALEFKKMRDRDILHNVVLQLPPVSGKNPFKATQTELEDALKNAGEAEVVRAFARFLGIGGVYAEELLLRANVEKNKFIKHIDQRRMHSRFWCASKPSYASFRMASLSRASFWATMAAS